MNGSTDTIAVETDAQLVARMGSGDGVAFAELVHRHLTGLLGVARRMLRDDAEAEDVAQEALLRLWRQGRDLTIGTAGVRPWLRRVVSNLCLDRIRSRKNVEVTDAPPEMPSAPEQMRDIEGDERAARVDAALKQLPERQRLALVLFHFEGLSQIEVAAEMGISDEAVESLLARARRALKAALANDWRELIAADDGV
ncbi:MAG: sigma-70 family RNA polymerase sigma factor [Hyphomicrobiaceae bacterium]